MSLFGCRRSSPLWKGSVLFISQWVLLLVPAVPLDRPTAEGIDHTQSLGVAGEFLHVGIVMDSSPPPLTGNELLKGVLAKMLAQEDFDPRHGKQVRH